MFIRRTVFQGVSSFGPLFGKCSMLRSYARLFSQVRKTRITPLLTLREVEPETTKEKSKFSPKNKPLVVLFDWLYANESALSKYCALYHNVGLDVLTVKGKLTHFLWPPKGEDLAESLMTYLLKERPKNEQFLIHAFSVGAYEYTICKTIASERIDEFGLFREKVIGLIFDSIVIGSYENMSTGIAEALNSRFLSKPLIILMDLYYRATSTKTKDVYDKLVTSFKENPIIVPTLIYFSYNDPMCHADTMEEMISHWNRKFPHFDVSVMSWEKSVHAAHLKFHQEDYLNCWWKLINKVTDQNNISHGA